MLDFKRLQLRNENRCDVGTGSVIVNSNSLTDTSCARIPAIVNGQQLRLRFLRDESAEILASFLVNLVAVLCFIYSSERILPFLFSSLLFWGCSTVHSSHIRAGHVTRMREKRNAYRILAGKPEGKRPL
jgi:hypothetical protein